MSQLKSLKKRRPEWATIISRCLSIRKIVVGDQVKTVFIVWHGRKHWVILFMIWKSTCRNQTCQKSQPKSKSWLWLLGKIRKSQSHDFDFGIFYFIIKKINVTTFGPYMAHIIHRYLKLPKLLKCWIFVVETPWTSKGLQTIKSAYIDPKTYVRWTRFQWLILSIRLMRRTKNNIRITSPDHSLYL